MPIPATLGRYRVLGRLGIGGMAEVFLGEQSGPAGFAKKVVVKRMLPHLAMDRRLVELFQREARIAARLNHPNVVQVYELGEDEGRFFIAMEYVDGLSVLQLARRLWGAHRAPPLDAIRRIIADAALGLHCAHELRGDDGTSLGVVHRDVSPDNLMVTRSGVTKVLDFGIAKPTTSDALTRTGELKGKIPFMAPEMIRGEAIDRRVDLYALGVSMYWLLTGRRPYRGETEFATIELAMRGEAKRPSALVRSIPPFIDQIVMSLLAKDKNDRVPTGLELHRLLARDLAVDVDTVRDLIDEAAALPDVKSYVPPSTVGTLADLQVATEPSSSVRRPRSPMLARGPKIALAAGGGALAVGAVGLTVLLIARADTPAPPPPNAPEEAVVAVAPPADLPPPPPPALPVSEAAAQVPAVEPAPAVNKAAAPANRMLAVKAPSRIVWRTVQGAELGRGSGELRVRAGTREIVAVDPAHGGTTRVPVSPSIDYDALPRGTLEVRAFPFARVRIGSLDLGTTPIAPRELTAGSYTVLLEHEGNVVKRTVKIDAGKIERVTAKMSER
ncbi:MAG: hypothetical protein A2138_05425 [Deltaproteobacteria bacterium RBG_16_71_12]|nr:MAG: hypothetical protein A2138_05425 [Deltaproteobacteria bacterium RBG_16_71_12]